MQLKIDGFEEVLRQFPSKDRFKFFFLFVLLSFVFWFSTKLSNTYQIEQSFTIHWDQIPKGIIVSQDSSELSLSITASGIEILWYRLFKNKISLSLNEIFFKSKEAMLTIDNQRFNIKKQLFNNTVLNQISTPVLTIPYSRLAVKKVKIFSEQVLKLRVGYLIDKPVIISPDSLLVRGSQDMLDTLSKVNTVSFILEDVFESFQKDVALEKIPELQFDIQVVALKQEISRYSEKEFTIPIEVLNIPKSVRVKLFPPTVTLKATMPLILLKRTNAFDFSLVVDYDLIITNELTTLPLRLVKQPEKVKKVIWEPKTVNYLIRK
ncbi:MAG: hypothetical protein ACI9TK_000882 [Flavobacteriaceae bacterium]|jgi:hypothetical protein|tara:strand:+ start:1379 stop:2341 length:963 start_codon:yes stop_codon:yes gene_type:complete